MKKVEYKKSIKKQAVTGLACFFMVCILAWRLAPVNTLEKITIFMLATIIVTVFSLWVIKKYCHSANCPSCETDLFEVINAANPNQLNFNFCPNCGTEIEI